MNALFIIAGIVWVVYNLLKDASIKPVPKGTDPVKVFSDHCSGKYTDKEMKKRIYSGYYVNNDK